MLIAALLVLAPQTQEPVSYPSADAIAGDYGPVVGRILAAAEAENMAFRKLAHLCDEIGPRLTGSVGAELAVAWTAERMRHDGLIVRLEEVTVPVWVRGEERAWLSSPRSQELVVTALGGSIGTGDDGIEAEAVVVGGWDELEALGRKGVEGKIVVYDVAMDPATRRGSSYGRVVAFRSRGAAAAARLGAVAALNRSPGTSRLRIAHTGQMRYEEGVAKIPAAAISHEDAELLHRLQETGAQPRVRLLLGCRSEPDKISHNVIGELRGSEKPDEIVVLGAHLDSWDLGTGAFDDGSGCVMMMEAAAILKRGGFTPRRTIRVVLYMNEENGLRGAIAYAADHADEVPNHVAAIESDSGPDDPHGFTCGGNDRAVAEATAIVSLLGSVGFDTLKGGGGGGADISTITRLGVPGFGLMTDITRYFDYHHNAADTLDKVRPDDLKRGAAGLAAFAYVLADMPERLGGPRPAAAAEETR